MGNSHRYSTLSKAIGTLSKAIGPFTHGYSQMPDGNLGIR